MREPFFEKQEYALRINKYGGGFITLFSILTIVGYVGTIGLAVFFAHTKTKERFFQIIYFLGTTMLFSMAGVFCFEKIFDIHLNILAFLKGSYAINTIPFLISIYGFLFWDFDKQLKKTKNRLIGKYCLSAIRGTKIFKTDKKRKGLIEFLKLEGPKGINIWQDVNLPKDRENQHILVMGSSGAGKTQIINSILKQILKRGDKVILWDVKGIYLQSFLEDEKVKLLAPWDARSTQWSLGKDILRYSDCHQIASILIPKNPKETQPYFTNASRQILEAILIKLSAGGNSWGWGALWEMIAMGKDPLAAELKQSKDGSVAANYLYGDSKAAQDVYSSLIVASQYIKWLAKAWPKDGISLRQWVTDNDKNNRILILGGLPNFRELASANATTAIQIMMNEILSLPDNHNRRIWLIVDELTTLSATESLLEGFLMGRSKGLCVVAGIQDIGRVEFLYGRELTKSISNAFSTAIFLRCSDEETSRWVSDAIGVHEVSSEKGQSRYVPAMLPTEIANLENLHGVLRMSGVPIATLAWQYCEMPQKASVFKEADWLKSFMSDERPPADETRADGWRL